MSTTGKTAKSAYCGMTFIPLEEIVLQTMQTAGSGAIVMILVMPSQNIEILVSSRAVLV